MSAELLKSSTNEANGNYRGLDEDAKRLGV